MAEFIYRHGLAFVDTPHLKEFEAVTPGGLRQDREWAPTVCILTMSEQMRIKAATHLRPDSREIEWTKILANDFGSGHYAAIYWAFTLWSGRNWGGWEDDNGKEIPLEDAASRVDSMDKASKFSVLAATAYQWGLQDYFPALSSPKITMPEDV